jgi:hypothetical protein
MPDPGSPFNADSRIFQQVGKAPDAACRHDNPAHDNDRFHCSHMFHCSHIQSFNANRPAHSHDTIVVLMHNML